MTGPACTLLAIDPTGAVSPAIPVPVSDVRCNDIDVVELPDGSVVVAVVQSDTRIRASSMAYLRFARDLSPLDAETTAVSPVTGTDALVDVHAGSAGDFVLVHGTADGVAATSVGSDGAVRELGRVAGARPGLAGARSARSGSATAILHPGESHMMLTVFCDD